MAVHKGFRDDASMLACRRPDSIHFLPAQGKRLLAQHMFARLHGFDRPFGVQMIRQWIIDHVDLGIREQRFIGSVSAWDLPLTRVLIGSFLSPGADCEKLIALGSPERGDEGTVDTRAGE